MKERERKKKKTERKKEKKMQAPTHAEIINLEMKREGENGQDI